MEARFAERLQNLKSEQDQAIRYVQSTIDREIHRAKKLYDNEFTSLSDAWRRLRAAYDLSASTIGSFNASVQNLNEEELERHLAARGMEEWRRNDFKKLKGQPLEDEYYKWSEWQRAVECDKLWRECRQQIDSTSSGQSRRKREASGAAQGRADVSPLASPWASFAKDHQVFPRLR